MRRELVLVNESVVYSFSLRSCGCPVRKVYYLSSLLIVFFLFGSVASAETEQGDRLWLMAFGRFLLTDKVQATLDLQPRVSIDDPAPGRDGDLQAFLVRGALGYQLTPNIVLYQGYAVLPQYEPTSVEHRPYQEFSSSHIEKNLRIVNRFRLEERLLEGRGGVSLRARHSLRLQHPVLPDSPLDLVVSDEIFFNLNEPADSPASGFDQNRVFLGVSYHINKEYSIDLGYLNQYREVRGGSNDRMFHILFLGVTGQFDLRD